MLAREGDLGEEFFVIESGTAEVTRGGAPVAKHPEGSRKRMESERRFERHTRRYQRFRDRVAGAPGSGEQP